MKRCVSNPLGMLLKLSFWSSLLLPFILRADCTLTNTAVAPLNDLGFGVYKGFMGGLYPDGANQRPPGHEAAGIRIATNEISPLDPSGNMDTNNGKIVVLSSGMSNTTQEWASKGTSNFTQLATTDPSLNPRVKLVDGAIGGQDAPQWTNLLSTNWEVVITKRLAQAGVTTNQVQVLWLKQALARPQQYGNFPQHAQALQNHLAMILRNAKLKFPNLKIAYVSCRTRAYINDPTKLNPEPFAFETGFADKWVIEDQISGRNNLNFDPAKGPAVAPWLAWGPYIWADGMNPRSDGFTWPCSDVEQSDFTHPSAAGGVPDVARQLLAFFKTDPTATPWFLRKTAPGQRPGCAPAANPTNGVAPLTVQFTANASAGNGSIREYLWTFDDGNFSTQANPAKLFHTPGTYRAHLTVTDTNGNTALGEAVVTVNTTLALWKQTRFTAAELANESISGDNADPDGDGIPNHLEYLLGLAPKTTNNASNGLPKVEIQNGYFTVTYTRFKHASDFGLRVETSPDLVHWNYGPEFFQLISLTNNGLTETITGRCPALVADQGQVFLRFKVIVP